MLGHGTQGTVCKALDTRTGAFVAIKEIQLFHPEHTCSQRWTIQVAKEIQFLMGLQHPNIVRYIESLRHGQLVYIIFEYIENGSLFDILQKFGRFSEDLAVCSGLCWRGGDRVWLTEGGCGLLVDLCGADLAGVGVFA